LVNSFNIAPMQNGAVITNNKPNQLQFFRWGLVPHWAKTEKQASRLINARIESIEEKPSFRTAIRKQRCLVLADSFYEWKKSGGQKYPYRIMSKSNDILLMAGIWEAWKSSTTLLYTFSILTTDANQEMESIHRRMPLIFTTKKEQEEWLSDKPFFEIKKLLQKPANGILKSYRVSQAVNSIRNNGSELHVEVKDDLWTLF